MNLQFPSLLTALLKLNNRKKNIYFDIIYTKNNYLFLAFLKLAGFITSYFSFFNRQKMLRIFLNYNNLLNYYPNFKKLHFVPSHKISVSLNDLKLILKSLGHVIIILSTDLGLITHLECLRKHKGGIVVIIFYM
jgi:ribosomal protein S8